MVRIEGNDIFLTRGNTVDTTITIKTKSGDEYVPASGDVILFAVKSAYSDSRSIIKKEIDHNSMRLFISEAESKKLVARKMPYVYDIDLRTLSGVVDTFISGKIYVQGEV